MSPVSADAFYAYQPLCCCYNHHGVVGMKYVHGHTGLSLSWQQKCNKKAFAGKQNSLSSDLKQLFAQTTMCTWYPYLGMHKCVSPCVSICYVRTVDRDKSWNVLRKAWIHALCNSPWIFCANCGSTLCATQSQAPQTKGTGRNCKEGLRLAA